MIFVFKLQICQEGRPMQAIKMISNADHKSYYRNVRLKYKNGLSAYFESHNSIALGPAIPFLSEKFDMITQSKIFMNLIILPALIAETSFRDEFFDTNLTNLVIEHI